MAQGLETTPKRSLLEQFQEKPSTSRDWAAEAQAILRGDPDAPAPSVCHIHELVSQVKDRHSALVSLTLKERHEPATLKASRGELRAWADIRDAYSEVIKGLLV